MSFKGVFSFTHRLFGSSGHSGDGQPSVPAAIQTITDADLPTEFRAAAMYSAKNFKAQARAFRKWCTRNKVYYYARPREAFNPWEAEDLAREAGCSRLILEDMS